MIGSEEATRPSERGASPVPPAAAAAERGWLKDTSIPYLVAGAFVLALISVLLIDWVPSSDPWAWLDWGQEITSSHISLSLSGGPSWKPFPVVFTTVFSLFGHAAPDMWLVVTRTAGLLAIIAMFRLGRRFGGIVAGVVAVIALCFVQDALFYFARGASEPVVAATTLWAIDRHLAGSPRIAYVLLFLATMNRPEFSAFLGLYAIYLWLRVPGSRPLVATGIDPRSDRLAARAVHHQRERLPGGQRRARRDWQPRRRDPRTAQLGGSDERADARARGRRARFRLRPA